MLFRSGKTSPAAPRSTQCPQYPLSSRRTEGLADQAQQHGRRAMSVTVPEAKAAALEREILTLQKKLDRMLLSLEARKQKLHRLLTLIVADVGADLPPDE